MLFFHLQFRDDKHNIVTKGGFTFCAIPSWDNKELSWGIAKCHENDAYNKRLGRIKSEGKAKSKRYSFKTEMMNCKFGNIFAESLAMLLYHDSQSIPYPDMITKAMEMAHTIQYSNDTKEEASLESTK